MGNALQERDAAVERWLREEVAPVYDAMKADPTRGIPARKVFAAVKSRHLVGHNTRRKPEC